MQYTGLKDKNGKEIYEGDVIVSTETSAPKHPKFLVVGKFTPISRHLDLIADNTGYFTDSKRRKFERRDGGGKYHLDDWISNREFYKMVGNIHKNPELA